MKKILFSVVVVAMLWSCGKDDSPTPSVDENSVPVITAKTFTVAETISDTEVIGKVTATDADDDALTFSIATNSDALFEITAAGDLSLASGKTLDAATKEQHAITVKVDDGEDTASATITIKVTTVAPTNQAPEMAAQEFTASEDITDADEIGPVAATDPDGDTLTFSISDSELFVISDAGVLTLAEGKTLDFETETSHSVTVSVTDGEETVEATITISVEDVAEADPNDKAAFVTTWKTEADGEEISLYIWNTEEYPNANNFTISWGDGTVEHIDVVPEDELLAHTYDTAGTYSVAIQGELPWFDIENDSENKLMSIEQWGAIPWKALNGAFSSCENMMYNAPDAPDLSTVEDMSEMFVGAISFNGDLSGWDTKNVTHMEYMFQGATSFNGDLSGWDTSNVTNMTSMFENTESFTGNISDWITSKVEIMDSMFEGATSFNGDISGWDTSSVTDMSYMFRGATSFNGSISDWKTENVIDMSFMFFEAKAFNGDVSGWNTSNVTTMSYMFNNATSFDQNLGDWDIGSLTNMESMLDNSGMSAQNFSNTLIGWAAQEVQPNVTLGAQGVNICVEGLPAYNTLVSEPNNWDITYNASVFCN